MDGPATPERGRGWRSAVGPFLTMGMQLALAVVVFFFVGRWLDGKLGTGPWLSITGAVIGLAGGFISFIRTAVRLGKEQDREAQERKRQREG